jgi:superfamily II DNA or RNA helicase
MKFESFRLKSEEELKIQANKAEEVLDKDMYPPDTKFEDNLDISNIKESYKVRYEAYVASLRAIHKGELDTNEIKHAKEWMKGLNNLDSYIKEHESKDNPLLREKQYVVYKKIRDFLEQGKKSGYVKLPTGTGKTILFLKIAEALNMKTLVVSPSKVILGQNAEETEEFTESEFGKYYGQEKDLSKKVTHITYHSLVNAVRDGIINPEDYPVEIFDEAHRSLGPERTQTIDKFDNNIKLYFTATPDFSNDKKLSNNIEEIFRMDVADGIREGLICQTQTIHAYTAIDLSNVDIIHGQYDQNQLEKAINIRGRNLSAIELYKQKFSHLKVFCNCTGVKHAEEVAKLFNEEGINSACITGNTTKEERERILREYKEGSIKVLTNARVLLEGFNEPSCSVTFNLQPTLSMVDAEQRARSGRLDKNSKDKWSYVVDFIDQNSKKPQVLYSEILNSDRVWDISPSNPKIKPRVEPTDGPTTPPINFDDFNIDGLNVVVDAQKIMEITKNNIESRENKEWTYETLRKDVLEKGIKSSSNYANNSAKNNWPIKKTLTSMEEFPKNPDGSNDWDTFLEREKKKEWTYETLRKDILEKGIKSSGDYVKNSPKNNWPNPKILTSTEEFPKNSDGTNNWDTFLEREKKKEWTYEILKKDVLERGIKSSHQYSTDATKNNWPSSKTLTSTAEFPKNPDGTNDWSAFLRNEKKKEWTYETLRKDILEKGIKSSGDYIKKSPKNNWPSAITLIKMPEFPKNPDGSNDWDTFLEREKKKEWTYETLRKDILEKGIKSSKYYDNNASKNNWPSRGIILSMPEFPKNPDGSNDWGTFLGKK